MNDVKDNIIESLKRAVLNDSYWLTRNDQDALLLKLEEFRKMYNELYQMRGKKLS